MRKHFFTLIELLVVIAIIAILAGMLLPALGQARDKAKETACINNEKQISTMLAMYADSFKGYLPPCYLNTMNYPTRFTKTYNDGPYLLVKTGFIPNQKGWENRLCCPSRRMEDSKLLKLSCSSYFWYYGAPQETYSFSPRRLPPASKDRQYLFGDTYGMSWDYGLTAPGVPVNNHKRKANWAKVDGSVVTVQYNAMELYKRKNAGNFWVPKGCYY